MCELCGQINQFADDLVSMVPGSLGSTAGRKLLQETESFSDRQFDMLEIRFPVAKTLDFAAREIPNIPEDAETISEQQSRELNDIIQPSIDRGTSRWIAGLGALGATGFMTGAFQIERSFARRVPRTSPTLAGGPGKQPRLHGALNARPPNKIFKLAARDVSTRVTGMDQTTLNILNKTIGDAMVLGKTSGVREVARAIQQVFPQMKDERSILIATTEMNHAMSSGAFSRAASMGSKTKQWITVGDDRVSQTVCQPNEAGSTKGIPIDQPFEAGQMTTPGHPRCRCSVAYFGATRGSITASLEPGARTVWIAGINENAFVGNEIVARI